MIRWSFFPCEAQQVSSFYLWLIPILCTMSISASEPGGEIVSVLCSAVCWSEFGLDRPIHISELSGNDLLENEVNVSFSMGQTVSQISITKSLKAISIIVCCFSCHVTWEKDFTEDGIICIINFKIFIEKHASWGSWFMVHIKLFIWMYQEFKACIVRIYSK